MVTIAIQYCTVDNNSDIIICCSLCLDLTPAGRMATISSHTSSINGTHKIDRVPTTDSEHSTKFPPSPVVPRRAVPGNPTPISKNLRPVPQPRRSKSPSPVSDGDGNRASSTLPAKSRPSMANGGVQSFNLSQSQDSATLSAHLVSSSKSKITDSSSSNETPPPPPERKSSREHPPPFFNKPAPPPVARKPKGIQTLPPKERPKPPPPFHTTHSGEKPTPPLPAVAPKPQLQPRSTTLPSQKNPTPRRPPARSVVEEDKESERITKGSINFLSRQNEIDEELSDSEDEGLQGRTLASISSAKRSLGSDTAPTSSGRVVYKSEDSGDSEQEIEGPPRKMIAVRQLSSSSKINHDDDIIVSTLPSNSGPDYMNQKSIDSALADVSGEEDDDEEEEEALPGKRVVIGQVRTIDRGKDSDRILTMPRANQDEDYVNQKALEEDDEEEEEEEEEPGRRLRIGQVRTLDRGKDADRILTVPRPDQDEDYVNQKALEEDDEEEEEKEEEPGRRLRIGQIRTIDRGKDADRILTMPRPDQNDDYVNQTVLEEMSDNEEDEEKEDNVRNVAIHSKQEDYVNQVELDKIEVVSPGATMDGLGYRTQDVIGLDTIGSGSDCISKSQADYVNDSALGIDLASNEAPGSSASVDAKVVESDLDYMNQKDPKDGYVDDDEFWKSIEAMNVANKIVIKSVAVKSSSGDDGKDYTNQDMIDTAMKGDLGGLGTDEYLTEDDYYTTDDEEDDEKIKVRNTVRARLKIKGTLRSADSISDSGRDYENQEVLEEDIIPMAMAPGSEVMNCLMCPSLGDVTAGELSRQPEAVISGGLASPTGSTGTDEADLPARAPVCTRGSNESTLDFGGSRDSSEASKSPPPLPPKSPPIFVPPSLPASLPPPLRSPPPSLPPTSRSPPPSLPPTIHSPPDSLSRTSTSSSSASSVSGKPRGLAVDNLTPGHPALTVLRQDSYPISSKPRSHTFADPLNHRGAGGNAGQEEPLTLPLSPRSSSDAEFIIDETGALSSNHTDYIPVSFKGFT